jgi:ribonuclease HI
MMNNTIEIWTDGSAKIEDKVKNIGPGGIGIYMKYNDYEMMIRKGYQNTKTGRMELKAIITALNAITDYSKQIVIYSDSQYVVKGITIWMEGWKHRGFLGVKNSDLWYQFLSIYGRFDKNKVKFVWLRGHTNKQDRISLGNEIADLLASYRNQKEYLENDLIL